MKWRCPSRSKVARRLGPGQHSRLPGAVVVVPLVVVALHLAARLPLPVAVAVAAVGDAVAAESLFKRAGQAGARPPGDPQLLFPEFIG